MGIDQDGYRFIATSGCDFTHTLTIGRQEMHEGSGGYAEPFLKSLGAETVDSLDASGFEGASIVHDLNVPIPNALKESFTCVIDCGSLEHVFNFPQALKSCMEMVALHGHLLMVTPCNNFFGHGFYQFSPEVFYRAAEGSGFEVAMQTFEIGREGWRDVPDPKQVRKRVLLRNDRETYLLVKAHRTELKPVLEPWPQQSDYVSAWTGDRWHFDSVWL